MADVGCGGKCAKYLLLLINFIFFAIAVVLLGIGIFLAVDGKGLHKVTYGFSFDMILAAVIVVLVVGVVMIFVAIIGCCGAVKENMGCLSFYSGLVILLVALQIVAVILAAVFYDRVMGSFAIQLQVHIDKDYGTPNSTWTAPINDLQYELHCCGSATGPYDWRNSNYHRNTNQTVPLTCCTLKPNVKQNDTQNPIVLDEKKCLDYAYNASVLNRTDYIYTEGCEQKVDHWMKQHVGILIGVVVGIIVIQIVFVVIACLLRSSVARGYEYV